MSLWYCFPRNLSQNPFLAALPWLQSSREVLTVRRLGISVCACARVRHESTANKLENSRCQEEASALVNLKSPSGGITRTVSCPQIKIFVKNYWFHMAAYNDTAKYHKKIYMFLEIYFSWKLLKNIYIF